MAVEPIKRSGEQSRMLWTTRRPGVTSVTRWPAVRRTLARPSAGSGSGWTIATWPAGVERSAIMEGRPGGDLARGRAGVRPRGALDAGGEAHDGPQRSPGDRLHQVGISPGLASGRVVLEVALRGHEHDGDLFVHVAQAAADRVPVHVGQVHVEEDEVEGSGLLDGLEAIRSRPRFDDLE